eukprot:309674-Pyramimonas_sp.AAC.1
MCVVVGTATTYLLAVRASLASMGLAHRCSNCNKLPSIGQIRTATTDCELLELELMSKIVDRSSYALPVQR